MCAIKVVEMWPAVEPFVVKMLWNCVAIEGLLAMER